MKMPALTLLMLGAAFSLSLIVEVSAFRGGGFGFYNDAPRSFGAGDFSRMPSTFNSGAFGHDISSGNGYRDVNSVGAGNKYTGNYHGSTTATNAWGRHTIPTRTCTAATSITAQ